MVYHLFGIGIEDDRQNVLFTLQSCFQMMYGFIAITVICHYFGREKASNVPTYRIDIDYNLPCIELEFRRAEIDAIEKELIEIEADLRIQDDLSHIREIALHAQKTRLKAHLSRHKDRIDDMGY
jgi:hypothetical protein